MYLPPQFAEPHVEELQRIVRENALGMLVTQGAEGLKAQHLPFVLDAEAGLLLAHVARANPVWREVGAGVPALVVFRGAQGYVSPNWYPGKLPEHRRVPTWNYEAVHAHGQLLVHDDARFVRGVVARLTRQHEATQARPWKLGDAPPDYVDELLAQIVGIELRIERLEGKRKLSQNYPLADREGAIQGLEASGNAALAAAMRSVL